MGGGIKGPGGVGKNEVSCSYLRGKGRKGNRLFRTLVRRRFRSCCSTYSERWEVVSGKKGGTVIIWSEDVQWTIQKGGSREKTGGELSVRKLSSERKILRSEAGKLGG